MRRDDDNVMVYFKFARCVMTCRKAARSTLVEIVWRYTYAGRECLLAGSCTLIYTLS